MNKIVIIWVFVLSLTTPSYSTTSDEIYKFKCSEECWILGSRYINDNVVNYTASFNSESVCWEISDMYNDKFASTNFKFWCEKKSENNSN